MNLSFLHSSSSTCTDETNLGKRIASQRREGNSSNELGSSTLKLLMMLSLIGKRFRISSAPVTKTSQHFLRNDAQALFLATIAGCSYCDTILTPR